MWDYRIFKWTLFKYIAMKKDTDRDCYDKNVILKLWSLVRLSKGIAVSIFLPAAVTKRGRHYIKNKGKHELYILNLHNCICLMHCLSYQWLILWIPLLAILFQSYVFFKFELECFPILCVFDHLLVKAIQLNVF